VPAPHGAYAVAKFEAEQGLLALSRRSDLEVVIVRPPLVLGRDAPGNLGAIARAIRAGVPLPLGGIASNRRDLVSLPVLGDLLIHAATHPSAGGQTFLVSDGRPRSTREIVQEVAALEGLTPRLLTVPPKALEVGLRALGRSVMAEQLLGDLEVDIGFTRARLGWAPALLRESEL
jgi:nucleoside-diphosphate-sugar epimerase